MGKQIDSSSSQLACHNNLSVSWRAVCKALDVTFTNNELLHSSQDYSKLYGAEPSEEPPGNLRFEWRHGRCIRCFIVSGFGNDLCVRASMPLSDLAALTALPFGLHNALPHECEWIISQRFCSYYEVTICQSPSDGTRHRGLPCVSVGVCTSDLSVHSLASQQAGWNSHSWALHGDDGNVFHGGAGRRFRNVSPHFGALESSSRPPSFGVGDVVGCGVLGVCSRQSTTWDRAIFFSLNGTILGAPFELTSSHPKVLWPCVGLDATWVLEMNFGTRPFVTDLSSLTLNARQNVAKHCYSEAALATQDNSLSRQTSGGRRFHV